MKLFIFTFLLVVCLSAHRAVAGGNGGGIYNPIEIQIPIQQSGVSNVWDFPVKVVFTSPTNRTITLGAFYHSNNLWMARFAPDEIGTWKYAITSSVVNLADSFLCSPSTNRGLIIQHPNNPKRLIYSADGGLYTGVGFGASLTSKVTPAISIIGNAWMDGGFRPPKNNGLWQVPFDQYLIAYGDLAGFNFYRYSDGNSAYTMINTISSSGNLYDSLACRWTDSLFYALRQHGFRIFMTIMESPRASSSDTAAMSAQNRYVQFCINRFGALVDFWELANESNPDSLWISVTANYFHAHDPYHHLVSMSYETPSHPAIDIISPHWYGHEADFVSDITTKQHIDQYASFAKPVIFGEQGDGTDWDSTSAMRMRGRLWSAFFNEGIISFWNTTGMKDCPCNEYLGWDNRRYVRVLQNFSSLIDSGAVKTSISVSPTTKYRAYGLQSKLVAAVYVRNTGDETANSSGVQVTVNSPINGNATWYDVHTGHTLSSQAITTGVHVITAPDFVSDIALIIANTVPSFPDLFVTDVSTRTLVFPSISSAAFTSAVNVYNIGTVNDTIKDIRIYDLGAEEYSIRFPSPIGTVILPGDAAFITVIYAPTSADTSLAMLSIVHSISPAWDNIAMTGTGRIPNDVRLDVVARTPFMHVYPNPFTTTTTIQLDAADNSSPMSVKIYDIYGRMVEDLGRKFSNRESHLAFDGNALAAGIYFCRMVQGNVLAEKILTLIK